MRSEAVVLNVTAPVDVHALRPALPRADAVTPVVVVGEAATGPAQHRDTQFLEVIERLLAVAVDVGNAGLRPDPQASVHARSQMLGEVAVELRLDRADLVVGAQEYALGRAHR